MQYTSLQKFVFLLILGVLLISCDKDSDKVAQASHTSLVYIVADNNLNSYPQGDIEEMIQGYKNVKDQENNTLLVYIDDLSTPRLLIINNVNGEIQSETIEEFPEQNSLDVAVMSKVISQALSGLKLILTD